MSCGRLDDGSFEWAPQERPARPQVRVVRAGSPRGRVSVPRAAGSPAARRVMAVRSLPDSARDHPQGPHAQGSVHSHPLTNLH